MTEETPTNPQTEQEQSQEITGPEPGKVSLFLSQKGLNHIVLEPDHIGIEIIGIEPKSLIEVVSSLKADGFNYLQCQGGYDEGPGKQLVCFYHLISMLDIENISNPREVRLKVFLDRNGSLSVPSLYGLFKGADWQERETYDMYGITFENHPHPKRLLMPEDWKGWPLRKDYVQPDFYEMQDAY
tara:strand:- start:1108 stop:1659 length:552 start_codon:yes stop_codon:yes gene_type:complete